MPEISEEQEAHVAETEQARGKVTGVEIKEITDFRLLGTL